MIPQVGTPALGVVLAVTLETHRRSSALRRADRASECFAFRAGRSADDLKMTKETSQRRRRSRQFTMRRCRISASALIGGRGHRVVVTAPALEALALTV